MGYSTFLPFGRRADERLFSPGPRVISGVLKSMSVFPSFPVRLLENEGFFFSPFFLSFRAVKFLWCCKDRDVPLIRFSYYDSVFVLN
jgi:hypothetical protein